MVGMTTWSSSACSLLMTRANSNDSNHYVRLKNAKKSDKGNVRTSQLNGSAATNSSKICRVCTTKLLQI